MDLGEPEEAWTAAEEAVQHWRVLAAKDPDAFAPELAQSLTVLCLALGDLKRPEAAMAAAEAVEHYRPLAEINPDVFRAQSFSLFRSDLRWRRRSDHGAAGWALRAGPPRQTDSADPLPYLPTC